MIVPPCAVPRRGQRRQVNLQRIHLVRLCRKVRPRHGSLGLNPFFSPFLSFELPVEPHLGSGPVITLTFTNLRVKASRP